MMPVSELERIFMYVGFFFLSSSLFAVATYLVYWVVERWWQMYKVGTFIFKHREEFKKHVGWVRKERDGDGKMEGRV